MFIIYLKQRQQNLQTSMITIHAINTTKFFFLRGSESHNAAKFIAIKYFNTLFNHIKNINSLNLFKNLIFSGESILFLSLLT